jgi:hypothetical protein
VALNAHDPNLRLPPSWSRSRPPTQRGGAQPGARLNQLQSVPVAECFATKGVNSQQDHNRCSSVAFRRIRVVYALQAGGQGFDPGHVHQPPENQLLKTGLFCDFSDFWNLGTITISRALQKPFRCPKVATQIPIYKDRVGLARPRTFVSLTPYSTSSRSVASSESFVSSNWRRGFVFDS